MNERYRIMARVPKGQGEPEEVVRVKTVTNKVHFCADPDLDWYRDNVPCRRACPADTRIPEYIDLAARGEYERSYEINLIDNVLPHVLGRVCAHPCEESCRHGNEGMGESVSICWLKRSCSDHKGRSPKLSRGASTGKSVAVIGSGPAGLALAQNFTLWGHDVTIYEGMDKPGGMLRYGIPRFRLPENLIDEEIEQILGLGVTLKTNVWIGENTTLESLSKNYDAVILAAGSMKPVMLNIENENARGVIPGLDFMVKVNEGTMDEVRGRVVVIGGGFTAMDCARSAYRLGADEVSIVYRRTRNELKVDDREIRETSIEGIRFHYLLSPGKINVNSENRVTDIVFQRNRLAPPGADGRRGIEPVEGAAGELQIKADLVIPAVSQSPDMSIWGGDLNINHDDFTTSIENVFATGDYVSGPSNIISAIGMAHHTSRKVDQFLMDENRFGREERKTTWKWKPMGSYTGWKSVEGNSFDLIPKLDNPAAPLGQRKDQNLEVDKGYGKDDTYWQGQRCYLCNHNIMIDQTACILCFNCVDVCPYSCILMLRQENVRVNTKGELVEERQGYTYMVIDETNCVRCGLCIDACPVPCITMEKLEVESVFKG
ncbi:hypothetical protein MNBD_NITROSPINAE02-2000 [hydrothermal vent metagenome]|uniref:4Fe-4S ferredoxin-type domain-containing protein n=1 Tax=hydrothermal vent metagenome TaxID=652676 RepID=A0A3B1C256_9ZZZZ